MEFYLEHVRWEKSGEEEVCYCPECRAPKLYLNRRTSLFTCFVCGFSGYYKSRLSLSRESSIVLPSKVNYDKALPGDEIEVRVQQRDLEDIRFRLSRRYPNKKFPYLGWEDYPLFVRNGLLCAPAYLGNCWSGYQDYHPERSPKYIFRGVRGLLEPMKCYYIQAILCEGLFDALRLKSMPWTRDWDVLCTFGNRLTEQQLSSVVNAWGTIALAFDNDKLSAFAKVYGLLAPYAKVINLMPPAVDGSKDWDEFFAKGLDVAKQDALRLCLDRLRGKKSDSKS